MDNLKYVKFERIVLKGNAEYNETWVQSRIAEDPAILGLGEIVLKDKERMQPKAGRLDILLQDPESNRRYEVEVQLGGTDESHIVRTIEYGTSSGSVTRNTTTQRSSSLRTLRAGS